MKAWNLYKCVGVLCLAGLALPAGAVTLTSADTQKADHPSVKAVEHVHKLVNARSQGGMSVVVKAAGELGNEAAVLAKLRKGQLDMGRVSLSALADTVPAAKIMSMPYLFRSRDHLWSVLNGEFGSRIDNEVTASGVVLLAYLDGGARSFYARKAIRTRSDFSGMGVRIEPSPVFRDLISELGAKPVTLDAAKVGDALRSGEIDAAEGNVLSYVASEHYKYAKFLSLDEHSQMPDVLLISKRAWAALKPAEQELLRGAAAEASQVMAKLWSDKERDALTQAKRAGVTVILRSQIAMTGIEANATKLYSRYLTDPKDLETVLNIVSSK